MKSGETTVEDKPQVDRKFQGKESFLSSQISLCVKETKPKIPDGGWGWFVVFAAFMLNVISEGVTFTFGLLYIEFLQEFKASKSATSWIGSLFMAVPLIVGPLASALVDKYGCKWMTVAGGVVTAIGFIISAYAKSIGIMYLTFGVLGGVGRGLTYVTAVVVNAFWFEKKRSVAVGIAASGAGLGTIVFSPLTTALLEEYGWRGTLLITAGIFGNMCVCGMLMRDPDWMIEEQKKKDEEKSRKNGVNSNSKASSAFTKDIEAFKNGELQVLLTNGKVSDSNSKDKSGSLVNLPTYLKRDDSRETAPRPISKISEVDEVEDTNKEEVHLENRRNSHKEKHHSHSYTASLRHKRNSVGHKEAMFKNDKYEMKALSCPNISKSPGSFAAEHEEKWYGIFFDILKGLAHFSLFLELHFLLLCFATIILFTWFIVPYFYLADHMTEIGYTNNQATLAISVIGFANTIGMIGLGWIGDKFNVAKTYAICLILCGVSCLSMMYFTLNYVMLLINCALFGLLFASCFALTPSLLGTLVPLEDFTMAYGLELLCEGIGNLTGPPLAGFLYDITSSWHQSFYQAGFWIIGSGILVGTIAYTKNRKLIGSGPLRISRNIKEENLPSV